MVLTGLDIGLWFRSFDLYFQVRCLTRAVPLYIKQQNVIAKGNAEGPVVEKHSFKFKSRHYSWLLYE